MLRSCRGDSSWSMTTTEARGSPMGAGGAARASGSASPSSSAFSSSLPFLFLHRFLLAGGPLGAAARAAGPGGQLHQLAPAEQRGGAEALALLRHLADDLEAERLAQALELLQRGPLFRVGDA